MAEVKRKVRFGGHLAVVIEEKQEGIDENYNLILQQIQDPLIRSSHLSGLLSQIIDAVHLLNEDHSDLVGKILTIKWAIREREVIELFHEFLFELVTSNPIHQVQVLKCLFSHFIPASCILGLKDCETCIPQEEIFHLIHNTLKKIFTLIPLPATLVFPLLAMHYPFMKKDLKAIEWYIKNLLYFTTYQTSLRQKVLELIISKALKLDTLCPKELLEKSQQTEESIFEMEIEFEKKETFVDKLDVVMETLLQFYHDVCFTEEKLNSESSVVFAELLTIFDRIILPIHDSSHIQFIMFYICSFKDTFFETFLDHLWKKIQDPNTPVILRQTALSYLASFLARAKYIPLNTILTTVQTIISWIHRYIKEREIECYSGTLHETVRHGTFYSACQAVFYVLIFKHKQILDLDHGFEIMRKFNLEHIVMSRLNPLKFSISVVVKLFASTMRQHQIVYCDTIIERNNRQTLPVSGQVEKTNLSNPLDSFFPFDPYCLKGSLHMIEGIYQEWDGHVPQSDEPIKEDYNDNELLELENVAVPSIFDHEKIFKNSYSAKSISPGFSLISPASPF